MSKRSRNNKTLKAAALSETRGAAGPSQLSLSTVMHYGWRWRRQLAPIYMGAAVPVSVAASQIWLSAAPADWMPGAWLGAAATIGMGMTGLAVHNMPEADKKITGVGAGLAWGYATALSLWPEAGPVWGAWALSIPAVGSAWWWGSTMRSLSRASRDAKRGASLITDLGIDATLEATDRNRIAVEWSLTLGVNTRATQIAVADVAHVLGVETGRVHVLPGKTTRTCVIRLLHAVPTSTPVTHPALEAAAHGPGGSWEPGVRSILEETPIGGRPDGATSILELMPDGDVGHVLVVGRTGSGKSVTMASIATGVIACKDAVFAAADIPKRGATFRKFKKAMPRIAENPEELLADLKGMLELAGDRNSSLTDRGLDKHEPTSDDPVIVYAIEELPATMEALHLTDPELAEEIEGTLDALAKVARSAGILLILLAQRPDFTALPTSIRAQITTMVVHALKQRRDLMGLWPGSDIDPSRDLPVKGMAYISSGGDGDPEPQRAWWQTQDHKAEIGDIYAAARPRLTDRDQRIVGWIDHRETVSADTADTDAVPETPKTADTTAVPVTAETALVSVPEPAAPRRSLEQKTADRRAAMDNLRALAAELDTIEMPHIPAGAVMPCEPLTTGPGDDEVDTALLEALAASVDGMSTGHLTKQVDIAQRTVQTRLATLAADGRVHRTGHGRGARWHITRQPALATV